MDESHDAKSAAAMSDSESNPESDEDEAEISGPLPTHRAQNAYFQKLYVSPFDFPSAET